MTIDLGTIYRLERSIELANIKNGYEVLDLGCENCDLFLYLKSGTGYTGIDKNNGNIKHDLEKGLPDTILNCQFDVIFMNEFIEHIENFKSLLIQCEKCLKTTGSIIISTPSNNRMFFYEDPTHIHCFRKSNMINLAEMCRLKVDKITGTYINFPPLSPYHATIKTKQTIYTEVIVYKLIKT